MQLLEIKRILKKNGRYLKMLEEYDMTGHLPTEKIRRSFTIRRETYSRLKAASIKKKKPMSSLLDEIVKNKLQ